MTTPPKFQKRKVKGGYEIRYGTTYRFTVPKIKGASDEMVADEADFMVSELNWAWERGSVDWFRTKNK